MGIPAEVFWEMIGDIEMRLPDYEWQRLVREGDGNERPVSLPPAPPPPAPLLWRVPGFQLKLHVDLTLGRNHVKIRR